MSNQEIAKILREMAELYEMEGVLFKPRAYEKAALGVEALNKEVKDIYKENGPKELLKIPGVGKGIAFHIELLLKKGRFPEYAKLKRKIPVNISELSAVEGVGPKMIKILYKKLKIKNLKDLEKAALLEKIRKLPRFGQKSEDKILRGIEFLKKSGGRQVLGFILPEIRNLEKMIRAFPEVKEAIVAGSTRRRKETIGDIDILATSKTPKKVMDRFVDLPFIAHVYAKGGTKTMVKLKNGLDADLRVVPKESYGAALNYFTGSKDHNIALREMAIKKGWKLNEYGLFRRKKKVAGRTEEEIYKALGLNYIEPEMRENTGELELAKTRKLPKLIGYGDLKGDLQTQTNWTDGEDSIEAMTKAAHEAGLEYIAITDHTKSLAMTGGSDEKKLLKQMAEIDKINKKLHASGFKIRVLKGAEVNIGKDGSLDIKNEVLKKLDVVGAAVHSHFKLSRTEQTRRIIKAMENPNVDIIFHLTGRIINRREPIEIDIDEIIQTAKRTGTVLEIDAYPDRLDIKDEYIRKCVEAGVKMSIDSDAHSASHFKFLEIGISQARRGWATKADIINAWPLEKMLGFLKKGGR
ncbi:DNA polymerase III [Candidatus Giovannonibacteria bacterium RIFCSPLOWO2_01_FULL_44_40]|uniref:DNA-directed DNA polymerase n=1 Tax=Candidatus Giovannonibacteria bacterium RIFCSPHIGHO2_01_FULL_45_23 TaxID=1798325 RepID=A0A1F5VEY9_9BACT|nr:MAG: DNA polymerase III [Candidatus Giovannonibacteria bacterium RIFCSPHIGHO2_01_FULL_45_23]OGF76490.1 MAG: DNA polymerase III [Candidatus Giovannonibacteria bacterium RIFCSPHIGHO2_02_FULL_45_13]OGF79617.1 MAG: DNA polymerase III [Candidatus Giovannonibacteria bacterium RIFCSPLOWO2_01_FULL_44_40]